MFYVPFLQTCFPIDGIPNDTAQLVRLNRINNSMPHIFDYEGIIKSMDFERLILFANRFRLWYPRWPIQPQYNGDFQAKELADLACCFYNYTAKGYHDFLKNGELKEVTFYMPRISFSERFQNFNITYYHYVVYMTGELYFYVTDYLSDGKFESTKEIYKHVEAMYTGAVRNIFADNRYYAFKNEGRRYTTGYTSAFCETDYIEYNFNVRPNFDKCKAVVIAPGIPSFYNNLTKQGRFNRFTIYTDLNDHFLLCTVDNQKWKKEFNYEEYKTVAFEQLARYATIRDLLSSYLLLLLKGRYNRDEIDCLHKASLSDSLKRIKRDYRITFDKIVEDTLKDNRSEKYGDYAGAGGRFVGGFISEIVRD